MVPGNLFSAADIAANVYWPMLHKGALIHVVSKAKKMNSRTGSRGSNKEVSGAKKGALKLVDRGSESGG
jgi:hypothetical protein